ncbi:MAG: pyridoxamine kinase [Lachnospiraceae bacterium]
MKRIALINDLSGFGKCSLTAAIPVISAMGIQACPLPTAILSAQTGFEHYYCEDFTDKMDLITEHWKTMEVSFDGIYSGYLADSAQIEKVLHVLDTFYDKDTLYFADPVLGDGGKTYHMFTKELLDGMKRLVSRADVITPNLTELCLLGDLSYEELVSHRTEQDYIDRIKRACQDLLKKTEKELMIIVTGIIRRKEEREYIGNLAVSAKEVCYIETPYTGISFSGTGDLFASVICGCLVNGLSIEESLKKAAVFLQNSIEDATKEKVPRNHGVHFEKYLYYLIEGNRRI